MNWRTINWFQAILVIALAGMSFWLEQIVQVRPDESPNQKTGVDFWADNFTVSNFGPDGKLLSTLSGERILHVGIDNSSLLIAPKLRTTQKPPLLVSAERGMVNIDTDVLDLSGNVKLDRASAGKRNSGLKGPLQVRTERMLVHPDRQLAEGTAAVRVQQQGSVLNAGSYRIDGRSGVSVLEGRVRASIPPSNF